MDTRGPPSTRLPRREARGICNLPRQLADGTHTIAAVQPESCGASAPAVGYFASTIADWQVWIETDTAGKALAIVNGDSIPDVPPVYVHRAAATAFALVAGIEEASVLGHLGPGIVRWWRRGLAPGQACNDIRFLGAESLVLSVGFMNGCFLIYLPVPGILPVSDT
jgi:hypothetical protein